MHPTLQPSETHMIDPGALGTLIIGNRAHLHDDERAAIQQARLRRSRNRLHGVRLALATSLRGIAARVDPVPA